MIRVPQRRAVGDEGGGGPLCKLGHRTEPGFKAFDLIDRRHRAANGFSFHHGTPREFRRGPARCGCRGRALPSLGGPERMGIRENLLEASRCGLIDPQSSRRIHEDGRTSSPRCFIYVSTYNECRRQGLRGCRDPRRRCPRNRKEDHDEPFYFSAKDSLISSGSARRPTSGAVMFPEKRMSLGRLGHEKSASDFSGRNTSHCMNASF